MATTLRLLLGDQLNQEHSWFKTRDDSVTYLLMELRQETDYVVHHVQKVVAFFAAMRRFAAWLEEDGHMVRYLKLDDPANTTDLSATITALIKAGGFSRFEYILPDEYRLDRQLADLTQILGIPCRSIDSEHFLSERNELSEFFGSRNYLMETFYREIRSRNGWLMLDGKPEGGRWNYDRENRKSLPAGQAVTAPKLFDHDLSLLNDMLAACRVETIGSIEAEHVVWPLDRSESLQLLDFFLKHCLADFGNYQDAMHSDHWSLFHSRLSFSLNTKMINPREVVERAISAYRQDPRISLPAIEGFIRQIIGWREFIRGVYWANMPAYATLNEFGHKRPLPDFYWTGATRMNCLRQAICQSLEYAYAHHIQRLMITGNFALLAGVDPGAVDRWYLGIYIDAIEWVEMVNTRGMSQFADGGLVATKPYVSSANYINKMSNYCRSCRYDHKQRTSRDSCPFNALYWNFLISHRERLAANHRMRMMYSRLDALGDEEKKLIIERAESCLADLDAL
jgi:deoxyribodipyrimidine photolyase-related protein